MCVCGVGELRGCPMGEKHTVYKYKHLQKSIIIYNTFNFLYQFPHMNGEH